MNVMGPKSFWDYALVIFLITVTQYLTRSNRRLEGLTLVPRFPGGKTAWHRVAGACDTQFLAPQQVMEQRQ